MQLQQQQTTQHQHQQQPTHQPHTSTMSTNAQQTPPPSPSPEKSSPSPPQRTVCGGPPLPPAARMIGMAGPAWTYSNMERPAGTKDMGSWVARIYTNEQQRRLNVDAKGNPTASPAAAPAATCNHPLAQSLLAKAKEMPRQFRCGVGLKGFRGRGSSPSPPPPSPPQSKPFQREAPRRGGGGAADRGPIKAGTPKTFPAHWGQPPRMQTRDLRQWPGGYGRGSGTVAKWIQTKMEQDKQPAAAARAAPARAAPAPAPAPNTKNAWPELVGTDCNDAKAIIQAEGGTAVQQVHCIPDGSMVTCDMRTDRVRIFTTADGTVASTPRIM